MCVQVPPLHRGPCLFSFSPFEADQTHRVRSWLPGSYQPRQAGGFAQPCRTSGRDWLLVPAEGVECSEHEGDRGCPSCF